ncbi:hypothetical protein GCM10017673_50090 [Streptosporangium violaceochromogenes]|nr:hypothetical protein GCM10017673_50090 [Streptosporangium violaceochromogenes]
MNSSGHRWLSNITPGRRARAWAVAATAVGVLFTPAFQTPAGALAGKSETVLSPSPVTGRTAAVTGLVSPAGGPALAAVAGCGRGRCWRCGCAVRHHCVCRRGPRGRRGPEGVRGLEGLRGPQGARGQSGRNGRNGRDGASASIGTEFQGANKFVALAQPDGSTLVRDPRTTPRWHDISSVEGYPGDVVGVALAVMGNDLHVTVRSANGEVAQATCVVAPEPGTGGNPAWPNNCAAFVNLTPPS